MGQGEERGKNGKEGTKMRTTGHNSLKEGQSGREDSEAH